MDRRLIFNLQQPKYQKNPFALDLLLYKTQYISTRASTRASVSSDADVEEASVPVLVRPKGWSPDTSSSTWTLTLTLVRGNCNPTAFKDISYNCVLQTSHVTVWGWIIWVRWSGVTFIHLLYSLTFSVIIFHKLNLVARGCACLSSLYLYLSVIFKG